MKLLIDSANLEQIKAICNYYPVAGVTTNPSILAQSAAPGESPFALLHEIRDLIGKDMELHVQVIAKNAEKMCKEAEKIVSELGKDTYIKIPVTEEGLKAIRTLSEQGFNITATAIYSIMQGFLAAMAGANYVAPYVNRIDNLGTDGVDTAARIHQIFMTNGLKTQVIAASFKNSQQLLKLVEKGVGAATVSPEVISKLIDIPSIDLAVDDFIADFERAYGSEKTLMDF